jgi:CO/xanthine dehydrogenase FAD-binding subunit
MITAYHRPQSLDEALRLITRRVPVTYPLGGGTLLSRGRPEAIEVVDLQGLGLNQIKRAGKALEIGATVTLQGLLESHDIPAAMQPALKLEAPLNLRNSATVAGTIVAADGRSTFITVLLALDAKLTLMNPQPGTSDLGGFLPLRARILPGALITAIQIPANPRLAFEYVSRTPADKPIVSAAVARWPSGRTRLALGGYGSTPLLAMDGTEAGGLESAARNAFHEASDPWGSADYRMDVAVTLARRCLDSLVS